MCMPPPLGRARNEQAAANAAATEGCNTSGNPVTDAAGALTVVLRKAGVLASVNEVTKLIAAHWREVSVAAHRLHEAIVDETK